MEDKILKELEWLRALQETKTNAIEGVKIISNETLIELSKNRLEKYFNERKQLNACT